MFLTRSQVREIDRRSIEEVGIPGIVLMENAGRGVAVAAIEELQNLAGQTVGRVLILCGGGNNGGDGLVAARHLHNQHVNVHIGLTIDPTSYKADALTQWRIVQAMRLPTSRITPGLIQTFSANLIVDAIFGTGLTQPPRDPFADIVSAIESSGVPVLSVDLPSGLDCDTGRPLGPTVKARRTVTFVAAKYGFISPTSSAYTGRVTVSDIGCPRELFEQVNPDQKPQLP